RYFLTLIVSVMAFAVVAQDVISAKDAAALINNDNVTFVSARTPADYAKVHIPGAVNIDHKALYRENSMLDDPSKIASILGENGIANTDDIIIYDDGSMKYSGRLYWIMTYMGAAKVRVIDGGMKAWRMARKPVTKNPTNISATTFTPKINSSVLASMNQVQKAVNSSSAVIVDVRSSDEFNGKAPTALRSGHIPSAINLEYTNVLNPDGTLKDIAALKAIFTKAGITPDKEVILYCESSVRAGIVFLALKSGLDYPKVRVYDGAYLEWQSDGANAVADAD
ncbi:MAG: sulfurtransferase, partial [Cyclobacteriaceae bacterium]